MSSISFIGTFLFQISGGRSVVTNNGGDYQVSERRIQF